MWNSVNYLVNHCKIRASTIVRNGSLESVPAADGDSNLDLVIRVHQVAMEQTQSDIEVRHIKSFILEKLASIVDHSKGFDEFLCSLSKPQPAQVALRTRQVKPLNLSIDQIETIKREIYCGRSPALALLKHWSITGRIRPTIANLVLHLRLSKLERAADYVCNELLDSTANRFAQNENHLSQTSGEPLPLAIAQQNSPPACINRQERYMIDEEFKFDNLTSLVEKLRDYHRTYSFEAIYKSTNGFCHQPYDRVTDRGTRIGDGHYSSVFRAKLADPTKVGEAQIIAAKLLKSKCNRDYLVNEIIVAKQIRHPNVLELLGISVYSDSDRSGSLCLIYPCIQNGSLQRCLSRGLTYNNMEFLSSGQRFDIARGIARGIDYLHNSGPKPIIHRDIKSANILIDLDLEPKIGDFTLVHQMDPNTTSGDTRHTKNIIGTSIYMPPEAFRGDISTKFDVYSYGIVLLELLSGLRVFDETTGEDLLSRVYDRLTDMEEEHGGESELISEAKEAYLRELLDDKAAPWDFKRAKCLFFCSLEATHSRKLRRPPISQILKLLDDLRPD